MPKEVSDLWSCHLHSFPLLTVLWNKKKKKHTLTGEDYSVLFGVCFRGSQAIHVNLKADATLPFTYFVVTMYMQSFKQRKLLNATKKKKKSDNQTEQGGLGADCFSHV